eukprot:TRINITY_DN8355_c0_g1_i2.p1 TRINITY_DN8355_c0_g1~~TRINITY_DN8355_c0_g1_i2.p1  ORF type:complete len:284 (-),score=69.03 TRINITY_DN8355_c0_g1_i2:83-934(-)
MYYFFFFFQAEDGIRDVERSRGLGDVYKRQVSTQSTWGILNRLSLVFYTISHPRQSEYAMNLNVRAKILLSFAISLILLCTAILTVTLTSIYNDSVEKSQTSAAGQLKHIDGTISMYMQETLNNTIMMAEDPRTLRVDEILTNYMDPNRKHIDNNPFEDDELGLELRGFYQMILKSHPSYKDAYVGTNTGAFIIGGKDPMPDGYDPRKRPWYKAAEVSSDKAIISKAYISTTNEPMISTGKAVLDGGQVVGVTALDLSLTQLTKLIEQVKLGETGYVLSLIHI